MYRQNDAEIKRTVTMETGTEPQEIEIIIKARGHLKPDQIKSMAEIADHTEEWVINTLRAAGE